MVPCDEDTGFPEIPANVVATAGDEFVRLTWEAVPDADVVGYQVHFRNSSGQSSTLQVGNVTAYSVYGLDNGTTYEFQVAALDGCGHQGGFSPLIDGTPTNCADNVAPPATPANVAAVDVGTGDAVRVAWAAASESDVLGYRVFWGTSPGTWMGSADAGDGVFHTVHGLSAGVTYYFSVAAYDICGHESALASAVSATPGWGCFCPPTVTSTTPVDYAILSGTIEWIASAAACSTTTVDRVEFRIDGAVRHVDYDAPFEFGDFGSGWTTSLDADGAHVLICEAFDDNDCAAADTVRVFVDNSEVGVSCIGIEEGVVASVAGAYSEQVSVEVANLSSVDTYHLDGMVLHWSDNTIFPYWIGMDGMTLWSPSTWPDAGPGDTLMLASTIDVVPGDTFSFDVAWWEYPLVSTPTIDLAAAGLSVSFLGAPIPSCGPWTVPFAAACSLGVRIVSENSANPYDVVYGAAVGQQYYTDRTYTLTYLPAELLGATIVRTPNNDKNLGDSHSLVLEFFTPVRVFIAYDPRGNPPDWIENFYAATGTSIGVTDSGTSTLGLWMKDFDAGQYTFTGNKATGWGGAVGTNYVIFVTCP
jgi:hypothetical protein